MKALLDFVKSPAGRKVLVLVVASALAAGRRPWAFLLTF